MTPSVLTLEPDQAREYCVNLVRRFEQFAVEIAPRLRGMKDVVAVYRSGVLEAKPGWGHVAQLATDRDTACQYVHNLIGAELSFQVNPQIQQGTNRREWRILVESRDRREAY
jgi:hypothetical protein